MKKTLNIISRKSTGQLIGLLLVDVAFFGNTNITKVPSYIIIVGLLLFSYSLYTVIYHIMGVVRLYGLPIQRKRRLAIYSTAAVGMLVALQSVGELSAKDVIVLLPLSVIGYIYLTYTKANGQKFS